MGFEFPIPTQICCACGIRRSRYIGPRDAAEDHRGLQAVFTAGEIAAVDQYVSVGRQRLADGGQLVEMLALHGRGVERRVSEAELTLSAVRENVDGRDVVAARERGGDLLDTVLRRVDQHHLDVARNGGEQRLGIGNAGVHECDFARRLRQRDGSGGQRLHHLERGRLL